MSKVEETSRKKTNKEGLTLAQRIALDKLKAARAAAIPVGTKKRKVLGGVSFEDVVGISEAPKTIKKNVLERVAKVIKKTKKAKKK